MTTAQLHRKVIGVPLQKGISKSAEGFTLVLGKFTSDGRDEIGDVITREATEKATARFRQWGNIRYMHQDRPVGRVVRMGVADGLAWNEVEIKVIDPQAAFEVEHGLLQALSIGALVNMGDVELMTDGGWIIHDYSLAEISLVDHPANYDARLMLSLGLDEAVRSQAREEGLAPVLRSMGIHVKGEKSMSDAAEEIAVALQPKQALEEQPVEQPVAELQQAEVTEPAAAVIEPEAEQPVADLKSPEVEEPVEETVAEAVEEPQAEVEPEVAPEAPVAEEEPVAVDFIEPKAAAGNVEKTMDDEQTTQMRSMMKQMQDMMSQMCEQMGRMAEEMKAIKSLAPVEETPEVVTEKALVAGEQTDDAVDTQEELRKTIADLQAKVEELSKPVDRKGMLPAEELPMEGEEAETPEPAEEERPKDLRSAIAKFVATRR